MWQSKLGRSTSFLHLAPFNKTESEYRERYLLLIHNSRWTPAAVLKTLSQLSLCSWFKHCPLDSALLWKETELPLQIPRRYDSLSTDALSPHQPNFYQQCLDRWGGISPETSLRHRNNGYKNLTMRQKERKANSFSRVEHRGKATGMSDMDIKVPLKCLHQQCKTYFQKTEFSSSPVPHPNPAAQSGDVSLTNPLKFLWKDGAGVFHSLWALTGSLFILFCWDRKCANHVL